MTRTVRQFTGSVAELHAIPMPTQGDAAELWVMRPTAPAVAMGSSQRSDQFDLDRLRTDGVRLASRRSGGGAVFIDPSVTVWIDVVAPKSSPLYSAELTENFLLVGRSWQTALASLGVATELCVESGGRSAESSLACWAGLGWGELTVGDAKIVGLSQRRTRWGSRVQAMAVLDGSSARVADYLIASDVVRADLSAALATAALDVRSSALETAVLDTFAGFAA